MTEYHAGNIEDIEEGGRKLIQCGDDEIGIFKLGGELYAWHNECAHRGGPVCQGVIMKRVLEPFGTDGKVRTLEYHEHDTHVVCPWHGYEYDIRTGAHPGHPGIRLRKADLIIRNGEIYVEPERSTAE